MSQPPEVDDDGPIGELRLALAAAATFGLPVWVVLTAALWHLDLGSELLPLPQGGVDEVPADAGAGGNGLNAALLAGVIVVWGGLMIAALVALMSRLGRQRWRPGAPVAALTVPVVVSVRTPAAGAPAPSLSSPATKPPPASPAAPQGPAVTPIDERLDDLFTR